MLKEIRVRVNDPYECLIKNDKKYHSEASYIICLEAYWRLKSDGNFFVFLFKKISFTNEQKHMQLIIVVLLLQVAL